MMEVIELEWLFHGDLIQTTISVLGDKAKDQWACVEIGDHQQ